MLHANDHLASTESFFYVSQFTFAETAGGAGAPFQPFGRKLGHIASTRCHDIGGPFLICLLVIFIFIMLS